MGVRFSRWLLLLCFGMTAHAYGSGVSAVRRPGENYLEALQRNFPGRYTPKNFAFLASPDTAISSAVNAVEWSAIDFSSAPNYPSQEILNEAFFKVRDERYLDSPHDASFKRRISWEYPDDGCFARAALASRKIESWGYPAPAKIFIFGNLTVKTGNNPYGFVSWWYHVAPIVFAEGNYYVLDPAINPDQPTPVEDWILTQVSVLSDAKVSVCDSFSYEPYSECKGVVDSDETLGMADQPIYLSAEWTRATELGRDPAVVLGDRPPWK